MSSHSSDPLAESDVLLEIIDALETVGIDRSDYRLHDTIDVEALERLLATATGDVEITFVIQDVQVAVDSACVTVTDHR